MDNNKSELSAKISVDTTDIDKATEKVKNLIALMEKANRSSAASEISKDKLDWLKSIGAEKLEHPMTWSANRGKEMYSDEYLAKTSLEVLKARHAD